MTQPPPLHPFLRHFGRGEYWQSHEVLEDSWRRTGSGFYKGLILLASAWVHVQRRNPRGVRAQARKAQRELAPFRPAYLGLDVDALLACLGGMREVAESSDHPDRIAWHDLPAPPALDVAPERVRGDEPELGGAGAPERAEGRRSNR